MLNVTVLPDPLNFFLLCDPIRLRHLRQELVVSHFPVELWQQHTLLPEFFEDAMFSCPHDTIDALDNVKETIDFDENVDAWLV